VGQSNQVRGHQGGLNTEISKSKAIEVDMMKLARRRFLHLTASAATLPVISRIAIAQSYPTRPVRIIVGFPAGGASDIYARLIGQLLTERLGQQIIIDNRPGANGNIGTEASVRAPADGHTYCSSVLTTRSFMSGSILFFLEISCPSEGSFACRFS
jgi:hypothetical protein